MNSKFYLAYFSLNTQRTPQFQFKKNKPNTHIECSLINNLASGKYCEANQPSKIVFAKYLKASTSDYLYKIWNNYVSIQIRNQEIQNFVSMEISLTF